MLMRSLVLLVSLGLALAGCGNDTAGSDAAATVVADQGTLPETEADEHIGVATAIDQRDAQWARFGMTGSAPSVDFADRVLLFVGFGESGSCPYVFDGIEVDDQILRLLDAQDQEACTSDYNPRTVVLGMDRGILPEGFITVDMPAGVTGAVISLPESAEPPPVDLTAVGASTTGVDLIVEPQSVPVGDDVTVHIANTTEQERVRTAPWVTVDRWTGHHFEAVGEIDPGGDLVEVGPSDTVELMTLSTADSVFAAGTGWFRVTAPAVNFMSAGNGRIMGARGNLQVIDR